MLEDLQDSCDWNVVERIVYDQRKWERDEVNRAKELRVNQKAKDAEAGGKAARQTNELVLLEVVEDFDMDVGKARGALRCQAPLCCDFRSSQSQQVAVCFSILVGF